MDVRYFALQDIEDYCIDQTLSIDFLHKQCLGICSIADVVELCENQKKGVGKISSEHLRQAIRKLVVTGFSEDAIYISSLEREDLSECLFEPDGTLWTEAAQRHIPPLHSVRRLTLRHTESRWWDEDLYQQMETFFVIEPHE